MDIKKLQQQDLLPALHLAWEVFAEDVAPEYTPEGVAEFQKFIKYDHMLQSFQNQDILFFGAFEETKLCGMIAVTSTGHICLFFVRKEEQGRGIGSMLFQTVYNYCAQELHINRMTVNAAPGSVLKYQHMGMEPSGDEKVVNGMRYVPMEIFVTQTLVQPVKGNKKRTGWIIGGVIAVVVLLILLFAAGVFLIKNVYQEIRQETQPGYENPQEEWNDEEDPMNPDSPLWDERGQDDEEGTAGDAEELTGIDAIPPYVDDNLSYEIEQEDYTYNGEDTQTTQIGFFVQYPKLEGLDQEVGDKINNEIKNCAMKTVDEIYNHPSEEFKEKILGTENPVLSSYVTCKVTYANNEFISIVIEDMGIKGDSADYYQELRTLNIRLKDGKVYDVKEIVNLDDTFLNQWLSKMRGEAEDDQFLSELSRDQMKSTLSGKNIDGNYKTVFFVSETGIEIGYSLDYASGDQNDKGYAWVTAPFMFEEIAVHEKDGEFWSYFK